MECPTDMYDSGEYLKLEDAETLIMAHLQSSGYQVEGDRVISENPSDSCQEIRATLRELGTLHGARLSIS